MTSSLTALPDHAGVRSLLTATGEALSIRAQAEAGGTFEGYACLWDTVDTYGTTFARQSFSAGGLDSDPYPLLMMHNRDRAVGIFTAKEDELGLYVKGAWDDDADGQSARAKARSGSMPELSVGFVPLMVDPADEDRFTQVRLVEVSQITRRMGSVPGAGFAAARGALLEQPATPPAGPSSEDIAALAVARARLVLAGR